MSISFTKVPKLQCESCNSEDEVYLYGLKYLCRKCGEPKICEECGAFECNLLKTYSNKYLCSLCRSNRKRCKKCLRIFDFPSYNGYSFTINNKPYWICNQCDEEDERMFMMEHNYHYHYGCKIKKVPQICDVAFEEID